ncbi:MAG TPA: DHA2 family efflux MFS transporter permease subunit [Acidimicrobiales bacterium]
MSVDAAVYRMRWLTMAVVIAGTMMSVLNSTIVNVALPHIGDALDAEESIEWVVSAYLLAVSVVLPVTGWLGDRFGHKRLYLAGLSMFTVGSLLCALAPTFPALVAARVFQGFGGGVLLPVGLVLILKVFPREEHGKALGVWGIAAMASPAIGPTLGGWLVDMVAWNWLFLINVPLGVATVVAGWRVVPEVARGRLGHFDTIGFLTGSVGLALFVLGLSEGNRWGWSSPATLGCLVGGVLLLVVFAVHELRVRAPMLELRMFRSVTFTLAFGISFAVVGAQYTRLVFVPLELQRVGGYTALTVGLSLAPAAILTAVGVSLGGRISDRIGARRPILVGVTIMVISGFAVAAFGLRAPLWVLVVILSVQGFGMGLHQAPATVVAMNTLPGDLVGQGSTIRTLASQVSGAVFVAGLGALLALATPTAPTTSEARGGYEAVFYASALGLVAALVMALFLRPGSRPVEGVDDEVERAEMEEAVEIASAVE